MRARVKGGEAVSAAACFVGGFLAILPPAPAGAVEYVRSIEYVEVSLGSGVTSASVNLTKGQDIANCVPFASSTLTDTNARFARVLTDIEASFLGGRDTQSILLRQHGANTRSEVLGALDQGASLLSYVGHGGPAVWASENVLNSWDPPKLLAQSEQPLMLTFNCLNGYFVAPNYDSLAEAFMKAEGRGTIGAFSPSGLSLDGPAHRFHKALMAEIVSGEHERLGDAVLAAQAAYAETGIMPELLAVYHLFGDPGMIIR